MGYIRVNLEVGRKAFDLSENCPEWSNPRDVIESLDALVAKVKAAYEAGS